MSMDIQNLVRDRIVGNIKIGTKGPNGLPQKLPYFNVEKDKGTDQDMVDIFKQLYKDKPTNIKIRFVSENPFSFKFKRYVNGKVVCLGNGEKAVTIGDDGKGRGTQLEVECVDTCSHRINGKCKLKGSLKFVLAGIEAGGVWNLSTSGSMSLSNIVSEILHYRKNKQSIVGVPFEMSLTETESIGYGKIYIINLKRLDIKPQLIDIPEVKALDSAEIKEPKESTKKLNAATKSDEVEVKEKVDVTIGEIVEAEIVKDESDNYLCIKGAMPTLINGKKFTKMIFQNAMCSDSTLVIHPKADQSILSLKPGSIILPIKTANEGGHDILCEYKVIQSFQEMKEAV